MSSRMISDRNRVNRLECAGVEIGAVGADTAGAGVACVGCVG